MSAQPDPATMSTEAVVGEIQDNIALITYNQRRREILDTIKRGIASSLVRKVTIKKDRATYEVTIARGDIEDTFTHISVPATARLFEAIEEYAHGRITREQVRAIFQQDFMPAHELHTYDGALMREPPFVGEIDWSTVGKIHNERFFPVKNFKTPPIPYDKVKAPHAKSPDAVKARKRQRNRDVEGDREYSLKSASADAGK